MAIKRVGKLPIVDPNIVNENIEKIMHEVGKIGVKWAVQNHEFSNRTGNLEDSYGYAVYFNGTISGSPFVTNPQATQRNEGESGHEEAVRFLSSYRPSNEGWTLVVVAGMSYANFVQFYYGLDVLQGSQVIAMAAIEKLFKETKWLSR